NTGARTLPEVSTDSLSVPLQSLALPPIPYHSHLSPFAGLSTNELAPRSRNVNSPLAPLASTRPSAFDGSQIGPAQIPPPSTCNLAAGVAVPMPMLPLWLMRIRVIGPVVPLGTVVNKRLVPWAVSVQ